MANDLLIELKKLREQNAQLEAELAHAKEVIAYSKEADQPPPVVFRLCKQFNLTHLEALVLSKLLDGRVTSTHWLTENFHVKEDIGTNTTSVRIHNIRRKITPYRIKNHWGHGFQIESDDLEMLRAAANRD